MAEMGYKWVTNEPTTAIFVCKICDSRLKVVFYNRVIVYVVGKLVLSGHVAIGVLDQRVLMGKILIDLDELTFLEDGDEYGWDWMRGA